MTAIVKGINWIFGRKFDDAITVGAGRTQNLSDGSKAFAERTTKKDMMTVSPERHPVHSGVVQGNGLWLVLEGGTITQKWNLDDDVTLDNIWGFYDMLQEIYPDRDTLWFNLRDPSENPRYDEAFSRMTYDADASPRTLTLDFPGWEKGSRHEYWSPFPMAQWTLDNSHSRIEFEEDTLIVCFTALGGTNNSADWNTAFRYIPADTPFSFDKDANEIKLMFSEQVFLDNGKVLEKLRPYTMTSSSISGEIGGGLPCRVLKAYR